MNPHSINLSKYICDTTTESISTKPCGVQFQQCTSRGEKKKKKQLSLICLKLISHLFQQVPPSDEIAGFGK